ncbi:ABC transporter permease [Dactylosporangium vinaceum]|uniref:FtsX-like permease family protein n=1 Tax=Dactylosporangium vinaceum TaxID=53362 RepID=A0ABV5M8S7_9ACTN|nr:FtsX-like permease family protein [Dactylosporangium vinaceum]UAB99536.1 ABC transporter permease [Dactylosporangium vinaceum]
MRLHWPSVRGRARADGGALLLGAAVVALVAMLAGAVPVVLRGIADDAVADAVRRAGDDADVTATMRWESDAGRSGRFRTPGLADDVEAFRLRAQGELGPGLRAVLAPPVASVITPTLRIARTDLARTFRMAYLSAGAEPGVTWTAGGAPGPTVTGADDAELPDQQGRLMHVGLSEATAAALRVGPGERIPLLDEHGAPKEVEVSGVFRATDSADPVWRPAPWLLEPDPGTDRVRAVRLGALLSRDSLPDARLAFEPDELRPAVTFAPRPAAFTMAVARTAGPAVVALEAKSPSPSSFSTKTTWNTQLDAVLRDVTGQVDAAADQMSVLLLGVIAVGVLVLLLAAELLVRRRAPALALARRRGAALPVLGAELLLESAVTAVAAAGAGLGLARVLAGGAAWGWAVPVAVAAAAGPPLLGVRAAGHGTRDRRTSAHPAARRFAARTRQLRRLAFEGAVLAAAAAAFVAFGQRGGPAGGGAALPAGAPTLGAVAAGLLLARLVPPGLRLLLRGVLRSRFPTAVFGLTRAVAAAGHGLALVTLTCAAALASSSLTVGATVEASIRDAAWRTVGADVRVELADGTADDTARRIAAAPGVRQVVAAQVTDVVDVATADSSVPARLVVVDIGGLDRLRAGTPLPGVPAPAAPAAGGVPALVRSATGRLRPGMSLTLTRAGAQPVALTAVGAAPEVGGAGDVVLVDAAALAAVGTPAVPNTLWVTGPGARQAVTGAVAGHTVVRDDVLESLREAPLVAGLLRLATTCAVTLVALGMLGLILSAVMQGPQRRQTLSRLRTLGLRGRDARRVVAGELLPAVVVTGLLGPLAGVVLAGVTIGGLTLPVGPGPAADAVLTPPWAWLGLIPVALLVAVAAVTAAESARPGRGRLAAALRVGDG